MFDVIDFYKKLSGEKSVINNVNQQIGEFIYPSIQNFTNFSHPEKKKRPLLDDTAIQANDIFASSMIGLIANPATKWLSYQVNDTNLMKDRAVQIFLEEAQSKALTVFNNPRARFYDNLFSCLKIIGAFGTGALLMDADEISTAKFKAESPKYIDFTEDFSGNVKDIFLEREFTLDALMENETWDIPFSIKGGSKDKKIKVLRYIRLNPDYDKNKTGAKFGKYQSEYWLMNEKHLLHRGFFNMQRVAIGRWDRVEDSKWADSPGRISLPIAKMLNASDMMLVSAVEKELSPTLFVSAAAKFGKIDTSADAINIGSGNPNEMIKELRTNGSNSSLALQWMEMKREQIKRAFYVDSFRMNPSVDITATQAMIQNQENLRGLAPKASKIQSDILGVAAEFVLDELLKRNEIKLPEALKKKNAEIKVTYLSPLAQAQRAQEAVSISQFVNDTMLVANLEPKVLDKIDFDAIVDEMSDIRGIPEKLMASQDVVNKRRKQRDEQQQAQALAQVAGQVQA